MVNNRQKSEVTDIKWSPDGKKICIIYFDGAIIIGGVDGSRHWGKEIKANLVKCDWSPDSKLLIFGTDQGTIAIYDSQGNFAKNLEISFVTPENFTLASIAWSDKGRMYSQDAPIGLIIAYESGSMQLMKNDSDKKPLAINANMII